MEKKITAVLVVIAALTAALFNSEKMSFQNQIENFYVRAAKNCEAALLYDCGADNILYEKNGDKKISVGSIFKVLTAVVALQYLSPDDEVTVGEEVDLFVEAQASRSMIRNGQRMTVEQLLYAMLLPSGCDAASTLAVAAAASAENRQDLFTHDALNIFYGLENQYLTSIGCTDTHVVNCDGQDAENQYTTLHDLILIIKKAMEYDLIREIVRTDCSTIVLLSGEEYTWENTNSLLDKDSDAYYPYATGFKTGYTIQAGACVAVTAEKQDNELICIVCHCGTRFKTASNLLKLGFLHLEYP